MGFVDKHRSTHGVEPICKVLQIAPSGYWRHAAPRSEPQRRCARAIRDEALMPQIEWIWRSNLQAYGADKVWRQLAREGMSVARCTVERLMRRQGVRGVMRGKVVRTTISDSRAAWPHSPFGSRFAICVHPVQRTIGRSRHRTFSGQQGIQLRQRTGRDDQRLVQSRVDPSPSALEDARGRRDGNARVGLVVQPSSIARTHWLHPTRRGRGKLLGVNTTSVLRTMSTWPDRGASGGPYGGLEERRI